MRDEHVPTDEKRAIVRALAKYGVRQHDIAVQFGVRRVLWSSTTEMTLMPAWRKPQRV